MPPPFVAYLRVYEPLSAFEPEPRARLERALAAGPIEVGAVGDREREVWLRTQLAAPPRILPGDRADGTASPGPLEVLTIDPATVPGADASHGVLVCPLDLRPRSAAALIGFLTTAPATLVRVALPVGPRGAAEAVRSRAETVVSELGSTAVHVVSSTWTVPLPWFSLVDPDEQQIDASPRPDPARRVHWCSTMRAARDRAAHAHSIVQKALGDSGPTRILADTARWLAHFHPDSVLELDYGGLVQLLDDDALQADTSAYDVRAAIEAMEHGEPDQVALHYERLRDFWMELAAFEQHG